VRHGHVSRTQDAAIAQVSWHPASGISQPSGASTFRSLDTLWVAVKTIQERLGHALPGSFTLDVYGGRPEWKRNPEAARLAGAEIEKAVVVLEQGYNAVNADGFVSFNNKRKRLRSRYLLSRS
jgi:hypothetical protein